MSGSLNGFEKQRNLKGYVVILECDRYNLALNYGPTLGGMQWNFDWISRATIFNNKNTAIRRMKEMKENSRFEDKNIKVVPVKKIAVLVPEVNSRYLVYKIPMPKEYVKPIKVRVKEYQASAEALEEKANEYLRLAKKIRKQSEILANQE